MKVRLIVYLLLILELGCSMPDKNATLTSLDSIYIDSVINRYEWIFKKAEDHQLFFTNGRSFNTHLFDLRYIGQVTKKDRPPYLIFSGRYCEDCDAQVSIYVQSPEEGEMVVELGANRHHYAGNEKDPGTDSVVYHSRVFYGEILKDTKGIIWYQKRLTVGRTWEPDIYLIDLSGEKRKQVILKDKGQLKETLALYKKGKCSEIKGLD